MTDCIVTVFMLAPVAAFALWLLAVDPVESNESWRERWGPPRRAHKPVGKETDLTRPADIGGPSVGLPAGWQTVRDTGKHRYEVEPSTGRRRIVAVTLGGHQPVDLGWLETGEWTPHPPPPTTGSGVMPPRR